MILPTLRTNASSNSSKKSSPAGKGKRKSAGETLEAIPFSDDAELNRKRRRICMQVKKVVPKYKSSQRTSNWAAGVGPLPVDFPFTLPSQEKVDYSFAEAEEWEKEI